MYIMRMRLNLLKSNRRRRTLPLTDAAAIAVVLGTAIIAAAAMSAPPVVSAWSGLKIPTFGGSAGPKSTNKRAFEENGTDEDYPWKFTGRMWFRPALVRAPPQPESASSDARPGVPRSVSVISLFGWTIGGVVALECK